METDGRFVLYRVVRELSSGAGSTVLLGEAETSSARFALKVFDDDVEARRQFLDEIEILSKVNHPNLVTLAGFGQTIDTGQDYLATPYIEGEDFVTASRHVSRHQFFAMLLQLCSALDYLHWKGIVHGDLKPHNIVVSPSGTSQDNPPQVRLLDFGAARLRDDPDRLSLSGTPHYLAPELLRGRRPSSETDLYALGVILFECITGSTPSAGSTVGAVLQGQLQGGQPRIPTDSLKEIHSIVHQLLANDPARRPASAGELIRSITAAASSVGIAVQSINRWSALARSCPSIGREEIHATVDRLLRGIASGSPASRPTALLLKGESGSGKTTTAWTLAAQARRMGLRVILPSTPGDSRPGALLPAMTREILEFPALHAIVIICDGFKGLPEELEDLAGTCKSLSGMSGLLVLTVDCSLVSSNAVAEAQETLSRSFTSFTLTLPPLDENVIDRALKEVFRVTSVDPDLARTIHRASGGNPRIMTEIIAESADQGLIVRERGSVKPTSPGGSVTMPRSSLDAVGHILDLLTDEERGVARLLAATDGVLTLREISSLHGRDYGQLQGITSELLHRGMLRQLVKDGIESFAISGEVVRKSTLDRTPDAEKKELHGQLARHYVSRGVTPEDLGNAGAHLAAAGDRRGAVDHFVRAATLAEGLRDYQRASRLFRTLLALQIDDHVKEAESRIALARSLLHLGHYIDAKEALDQVRGHEGLPLSARADVELLRGRCAARMGDPQTQEEAARASLRIGRGLGEWKGAVEATILVGSALSWRGRHVEGQRLLALAARRARRAGLRVELTEAMSAMARSLWIAGNYKLALRYARRCFGLLPKNDPDPSRIKALQNIALLQAELGMPTQARRNHTKALAQATEMGAQSSMTRAQANLGETYRTQGAWRASLTCFRKALGSARRHGENTAALTLSANLASVLASMGYADESLQFLRHSMREVRAAGSAYISCLFLLNWSQLLVSVGAFDTARKICTKGHSLIDKHDAWQWKLEQTRLTSLSLAGLGNLQEARQLLDDAIARYGNRSGFDARMAAQLTRVELDGRLKASLESIEAALLPLLETARRKKMRWHLTKALQIWGEALLGANQAEAARQRLQESVDIARKNSDRTLFWQGHYLLGRACEQLLAYPRALSSYRIAALTIRELGMNLEEDRYRETFLAQPRVREALDRHDRLQGQVGKQARRDLATSNRSEMVSRRMLGALNVIGTRLASTLDLQELMTSILDLAIENVRAERGVVFLRDEASGEMRPECARGIDREGLGEMAGVSRTVLQQVLRGQTILTIDVGKDPALSTSRSLVLHEIKSILCVPMRARGRIAGVIYLDTRRGPQLFTEKERAFVESFASQAAIAIENAKLFGAMDAENTRLQREAQDRGRFESLIGTSPAMARLRELLAGVLDTDCNVLIVGESGTGKELMARALHYNGPRQKRQFVAVDCGALPEPLLEAELFGHARGAFTDAAHRIGLIESAHGGTLFLDEITNTTPAMQAKLLRVLQEHEVRRLGENTPRRVDLRVVAATNADVTSLIEDGRFRQDLYYRINVVTIEAPPLRHRLEDIPLLASHFLEARARNGAARKRLGPGVTELLCRHAWPGNVRELENVIERLVVLTPGSVITTDALPDGLRPRASATAAAGGDRHSQNAARAKTGEHLMIEEALRRFEGDKSKAARYIGWNRQKLYRRIREYGIPAGFGKATDSQPGPPGRRVA